MLASKVELGGKLRIVGGQIGDKTDMAGSHRVTLAGYAIWLYPFGFDFNLIKYFCCQLYFYWLFFKLTKTKKAELAYFDRLF